jgi:hypothetical protein
VDDRGRSVRWYHDAQGDVNALAAEFDAVRREAIEECAKVAERSDTPAGDTIAAAIRAMSNVCTGCNSTPCVCSHSGRWQVTAKPKWKPRKVVVWAVVDPIGGVYAAHYSCPDRPDPEKSARELARLWSRQDKTKYRVVKCVEVAE